MLHAPTTATRSDSAARGHAALAAIDVSDVAIEPAVPGNQKRLRGFGAPPPLGPSRTPLLLRKCDACEEEDKPLQTKLAVSEPGDVYEQEADRVSDEVMRMPAPSMREGVASAILQRHASDAVAPADVPPVVGDGLRSPGAPLAAETRAFMEPRFGRDFGDVRVHHDARADRAAAGVNARAFTLGRDVVFAAGAYEPGSERGKRLLAHELTHVVQQGSGLTSPQLQRDPPKDAPAPAPAPAPCNVSDVFTELDPGTVLPSAYFRNGEGIFKDEKQNLSAKDNYKAQLAAAKTGKCATDANFSDIALSWDLGNPKLKSWWTVNINKDSHSFDINNQLIYSRNPCCACFSGTLSWSFNVEATRIFDKGAPTEHTETGKTKAPLTGSKASKPCAGAECCAINKTFPLSLWLGKDSDGVSIDFKGTATLAGKIYEKKA